MLDETTKPTLELLGVLEEIKAELDYVSNNKTERDKVIEAYRLKILPNLLKMRRLNRISKDRLEAKYDEVRQLSRELVDLNDYCDNLTFEASCVNYEVASAKQRLSPRKQVSVETQDGLHMANDATMDTDETFDPEVADKLNHEERQRLLQMEGVRRKELCEKLDELVTETDQIEQLCHASEQQINRVKPHIKQLLDKVDTGDANSIRQEKDAN